MCVCDGKTILVCMRDGMSTRMQGLHTRELLRTQEVAGAKKVSEGVVRNGDVMRGAGGGGRGEGLIKDLKRTGDATQRQSDEEGIRRNQMRGGGGGVGGGL